MLVDEYEQDGVYIELYFHTSIYLHTSVPS